MATIGSEVLDPRRTGSLAQYAGLGPKVSPGYYQEATAFNDIIIDIAGVYFKLRSFQYTKNLTEDEEYGSGGHLPWDIVDKQIAITGNFEYASFLKSGEPAMSEWQRLALHALLENQGDEGQALFFNIIVMKREVGGAADYGDFIEALINCKVTSSGRTYPENNTVITRHEFKAMGRLPK